MGSLSHLFDEPPHLERSQNTLRFKTPGMVKDQSAEELGLIDTHAVHETSPLALQEFTKPETPAPISKPASNDEVSRVEVNEDADISSSPASPAPMPLDSQEDQRPTRQHEDLYAEAPQDFSRGWGAPSLLVACAIIAAAAFVWRADVFAGKNDVVVRSSPEGALVELEGVPIGPTTLTLSVDPDQAVFIRVTKRGFVPYELKDVRLKQESVFVQLKRAVVTLTLSSSVPNATVKVNGREVGVVTQESSTFVVEWPERDMVLTLHHPDYEDFTERVPSSRVESTMRVVVDDKRWQRR